MMPKKLDQSLRYQLHNGPVDACMIYPFSVVTSSGYPLVKQKVFFSGKSKRLCDVTLFFSDYTFWVSSLHFFVPMGWQLCKHRLWCSLELPCRGGFAGTHHLVLNQNKKNNVYPNQHHLSLYNSGFPRVFITWT